MNAADLTLDGITAADVNGACDGLLAASLEIVAASDKAPGLRARLAAVIARHVAQVRAELLAELAAKGEPRR